MRGWCGVALILGAAACEGNPFAPLGNVERFNPPAIYRDWYQQEATCAGLTGRFDAITWEVADSFMSAPGQRTVFATWTAPHLIRLRRDQVMNEYLVKHEMLHDLVQSTAEPDPPFGACETMLPAGRSVDRGVAIPAGHWAPHRGQEDNLCAL